MICQMCKHEWCWACNEDFPVHTPECPNYHLYLEILEFQGLNGQEIHHEGWGWFNSGRRASALYWICSFFFLLIIALPLVVLINCLLSPCYTLVMLVSCLRIDRSRFRKCYCIFIVTFLALLLYVSIPVIFCLVTLPQIFIFAVKKILELKQLCKNKCRFYRRLGITPIMNKYFDKIGLR